MAVEVQLKDVAPKPRVAETMKRLEQWWRRTSGVKRRRGKAGESTGAEDQDEEAYREGEDRVGAVPKDKIADLLVEVKKYAKLELAFADWGWETESKSKSKDPDKT